MAGEIITRHTPLYFPNSKLKCNWIHICLENLHPLRVPSYCLRPFLLIGMEESRENELWDTPKMNKQHSEELNSDSGRRKKWKNEAMNYRVEGIGKRFGLNGFYLISCRLYAFSMTPSSARFCWRKLVGIKTKFGSPGGLHQGRGSIHKWNCSSPHFIDPLHKFAKLIIKFLLEELCPMESHNTSGKNPLNGCLFQNENHKSTMLY